MTHERELLTEVPLCLPDGRLNRDAIGWARSPLVDTSGIGHGPVGRWRNKRWEYWGLVTGDHLLGMTISMLDYACLTSLWVFDRATGTDIDLTVITPLSLGSTLPPSLGHGPARANTGALGLAIDEVPGGTRLRGRSERVQFDIVAERPDGHECMAVVVPWSDRLFQYTVKDVARPAQGVLRVDGRAHRVRPGESWAVLDHGRGRWPRAITWNWGAGSGVVDGHTVGVQLGGGWTQGTGSTENALFLDGRVHKIGDELTWQFDTSDYLRPWRITGRRADLTFTPFHDRVSRTDLGVIASATDQCFGYYTGWLAADDGEHVPVDGAVGWAEHVTQKW